MSSAAARFLAQVGGRVEAGAAVLHIACGVIDRVDALWGYAVGDALRARAAALLREQVLREGDLIGETGRDELVCVLPGVTDPAVAALAAEKSLRSLQAPFWAGDDEIFASPAVGIALCPLHGTDAALVLQRALGACQAARGNARRVVLCDDDPGTAGQLLHDSRLRTAVADDSLVLAFQPQYDLRLGNIMGAEALLRWPAGGTVAAREAFAAAEAAGIVPALLSSILNRALRNISEFRYSAGLDLRIAVGLPARALLHAELPDVVQASTATWRLRPGRLVFGIGETALLRAEPVARETLGRLRQIGVRLAIDDPHMELAALFEFAALPFQELRVDAAPAGAEDDGSKQLRVLQSVVELAHHLDLEVLAAGPADDAAQARLKALGCDYVQSDSKAPPADPEQFVRLYGDA